MKLKSLNFGRPRLGQVLMPLAAIVLGSGGSLVWANANAAGAGSAAPNAVHSPSEADQAVTALAGAHQAQPGRVPLDDEHPVHLSSWDHRGLGHEQGNG